MIFDRISLASAYKALKVVELNDGAIKDILFNKTSYYGTKTVDRFDTLVDLKNYINTNATYQHFDPECQCGISDNESIWMPLSFNLTLPNNTYATFVNSTEKVTVAATAATGTINYDTGTQSVVYYTSNAAGDWTINFRDSFLT